MNMTTTTLQLMNVPLSERGKNDLSTYAQTLVSTLYADGGDVLTLLAESAKLEYLAAAIKLAARQIAVQQVRPYGAEGLARLGVTMQVREVGIDYDYAPDPIWQRLRQTEHAATKARKDHETLLRCLPVGGQHLTDGATGELYHAVRPVRLASDGIVLTIL